MCLLVLFSIIRKWSSYILLLFASFNYVNCCIFTSSVTQQTLCAPRRLGTVILEKLKSSESVSSLLASKQIPRTPPKPKTSPHPRIPQTQSGKCLFYILAWKVWCLQSYSVELQQVRFLTLIKQVFLWNLINIYI